MRRGVSGVDLQGQQVLLYCGLRLATVIKRISQVGVYAGVALRHCQGALEQGDTVFPIACLDPGRHRQGREHYAGQAGGP